MLPDRLNMIDVFILLVIIITTGFPTSAVAASTAPAQNVNSTNKLIFWDTKNHVVETIIGNRNKEEITFKSAGNYYLTIQNDEEQALWYSFIRK